MSRRRRSPPAVLTRLAGTELMAGLAGLRLFIAAVALGTGMLGLVWMLAAGASDAFERNGRQIVGGDVELRVPGIPLDPETRAGLEQLGTVSRVADIRSTVRLGDRSSPVELRAVDGAYPLFGTVGVPQGEVQDLLRPRDGRYGAVVESTLLDRLGARVGDVVTLGATSVEIRGVLTAEPDRLGAGTFLIGPRMLVAEPVLAEAALLPMGALVDHRYRLAYPPGADPMEQLTAIRRLEPETGWRVATPWTVATQVRQALQRTETFLGIAGVAAMAVGVSGAWAAAGAWVRKRGRTIALYRLSGAGWPTVAALHAIIVGVASVAAILIGFAVACVPAALLLDYMALRLPVSQVPELVLPVGLVTAGVTLLGVAGAAVPAITAASRIRPGAAMRSGEAPPARASWEVAIGAVLIAAALALAVLRLPDAETGAIAVGGLIVGALLLALAGRLVALAAQRIRPRGFVAAAAARALADGRATASKAVAIGVGIAAITAVDTVSAGLDARLQADLPQRLPSLILIDIQRDQRGGLDALLSETPGLSSVELKPNLRTSIRAVNGEPARERLVDYSERWVLDGDHGLTWTAQPLAGPLWSGTWWTPDYEGPPVLLSISDNVARAFRIGPGATITFSVMGRELTGEVANVRDMRRQQLGANYIIAASPYPLSGAPHSWIATIDGADLGIDALIAAVRDAFPNVTAIDVRALVAQLTDLIDGATLATYAVALALLATGAIALAAVIAADADARAREGLAFALVGASRGRIAAARIAEVAAIGAVAAVLGGAAGILGGRWLAEQALKVESVVTVQSLLLPVVLGVVASVAAGLAAGVVAMPKGRGNLISRLAA